LLSKAAVRDVGRVLQLPYGQVDRLSKMIPLEGVKPVSITKALADEPRLREAAKEEVVGRLLGFAQQIEGLYRNASTHAAGVVIGDRPLDELVPLYQDPRSDMPATQFNMKWVEAAGLVKFDFLGLKTLTVIQNCMELLALRGISFDINLIPLDDKPSYDLYASAKTVAVFQVESSGMMDALRRMKPTCIEDIVALVDDEVVRQNDRLKLVALTPLQDFIVSMTQDDEMIMLGEGELTDNHRNIQIMFL
jgi:DNA polymerase-3 subunit alpha